MTDATLRGRVAGRPFRTRSYVGRTLVIERYEGRRAKFCPMKGPLDEERPGESRQRPLCELGAPL